MSVAADLPRHHASDPCLDERSARARPRWALGVLLLCVVAVLVPAAAHAQPPTPTPAPAGVPRAAAGSPMCGRG